MFVQSTSPTFHVETAITAKAIFADRPTLADWWGKHNKQTPFDLVVADRLHDEPNACILRVGLGYANAGVTIKKVFKAAISIGLMESSQIKEDKKSQPTNIYSIERVLEARHAVYEINGITYQVSKLLSRSGCYGDIFLAKDISSCKEAVIKVLRKEEDLEHHMMEKIQARGGHPNIVKFYGSAKIMGKTWIAMEYVEGKTLNECKYPWGIFAEQYQQAVAFVHQCGAFWEDENMGENILVTLVDGQPQIKLIDFGTLSKG